MPKSTSEGFAKTSKSKPVSMAPQRTVRGKPSTMEELLEATGFKIPTIRRGQEISGKVVSIAPAEIMIDVGAKSEGIVTGRELAAVRDLVRNLSVGDEVEVTVVYPENDAGQVVLSMRKLSQDVRWMDLEEKRVKGEPIEVVALEVNRGGVICDWLGIRGFLPSSQLFQPPSKLTDLIGKSLTVNVLEADRQTDRLIFSQKPSDKKDLEKVLRLLKKVEIGKKLSGTVSAILPFGIFVEVEVGSAGPAAFHPRPTSLLETNLEISTNESSAVTAQSNEPAALDAAGARRGSPSRVTRTGGKSPKLEGLVHISEISWEKVDDVAKLFKIGEPLEVMVVAKDEKTGRLNLSIKQLADDPFSEVSSRYSKDETVEGVVTKITPFGVIITLEAGIEGLMHISKMPPNEIYQAGQKIACIIESIDTRTRRISLVPIIKEKPILYR